MLIFYLLALIPVVIGGILWICSKKVVWWEWLVSSALGFITAGIMHIVAINGLTTDIQTKSGQIIEGRHNSKWEEYYEYEVDRIEYYEEEEMDSKGNMHMVTESREVFDHWEPTTRLHNDSWICNSNINTDYDIGQDFYHNITIKFGDERPVKGNRTTYEHNSRMITGDPNDYISSNKTNYVIPVTKTVEWTNRVKGAGPTTFSFQKVDKDAPVFDWPEPKDPFTSNRLINKVPIDILIWDQMNARLGPTKHVNVIMINFTGQSEEVSELQRAKVLGGKKNDLYLLYGNKWADCWGWTESENVKSNLKTILLSNPVNNDIVPLIEAEIKQNYVMKNWKKFDYLTIKPRPIHYIMCVISITIVQVIFWIISLNSGVSKDEFMQNKGNKDFWPGG